MDYRKVYQKKLKKMEDALQLICSGDTVILGGACNAPSEFGKKLHTQAERLRGVTVHKDHDHYYDFVRQAGMAEHIRTSGFFFSKDLMEGMSFGNTSFYPTDLCNYASFIRHKGELDVFVVAATTMDEQGNFQIGLCNMWEGDTLEYALECGAKIIVEVNPNLPRVTGGTLINVVNVTCCVEVDTPLPQIPVAVPDDDELKVAQNVRSLMKDGDCVQFGIGSLPDAIAAQCMDLRDLGLHTEMLTTALGKMIREGVITGERKNINRGEHLFTFAMGDEALYRTLEQNSACRNVKGSYGVNPMVICKNDNMVSVNTLIEMDLTGQICSESIGTKQYSGSGGGFDFAYGAMMSKGGRGIMAFTSKTKKGYSKIKPILTPGAVITVPRNYADYNVTEYGIAPMRGRTVRERVNNLIAVAHPDVREELRAAARKLLYI